MRRNFGVVLLVVAWLAVRVPAQIGRTMPAPPQVTPPALQKHGPPSQPQTQNQGVVVGYVYWNTAGLQYNQASPCQGLSVTISLGTGPNPTQELFKPLGTYNSFSSLGNIGGYAVCEYAVHQVPLGQDLQVQIGVAPSTFSPAVAPSIPSTANNPSSPIKIIGGTCNHLPPAVPSVSVLGSGWWTCGDYAYNVNFVLHALSIGRLAAGANTRITLATPSPGPVKTSPGLLPSQSRGMLMGGASAVPQQATPTTTSISPTRPSQVQQPILTNADVIKLVRGGVPELVVISKIQSARKGFDFSSSGCRALVQARVSAKVLEAMGDRSVQPCSSDGGRVAGGAGGNSQLLPAANGNARSGQLATTAQNSKTLASKLKVMPGKKIRVSNRVQSADSAITQTLLAQSLETHKEKLAVSTKARVSGSLVHPSSTGGSGPLQVLDSTTDPATGSSTPPGGDPAGGTPPAGSGSGQPPLQQSGNPPTQATSGQTLMQRAIHAPQPISMCRFTTEPVIETISGKQHTIVFTPDPGNGQYPANQYVITGCNFGAVQGSARIFGSFINNPSPVNLGIDLWSDSQIVVTFNPTFQNEYDLKSVTLAIVRTDGHTVQFPGISFYATRESRSLARVPHSVVKLPTGYLQQNMVFSPVNTSTLTVAGLAPPAQPVSIAFWIFDPIWSSNVGDGYPPSRLSFSDSIDFSQLRPGFVLDGDVQTVVGVYAPDLSSHGIGVDGGSCKYFDVVVSASQTGNTLTVGVQPAECDNSGKFIYAYYGLELSVTGPKGTLLDPWPGGLQ